MQARFPVQKNWLGLYQGTFSQPLVSIDSMQKRIKIQLHVDVAGPVIAAQSGSIVLSSGLRLDADKQSLLLREPMVEQINFTNVPPSVLNALQVPLKLTVQSILDQYVVYQLKPEEQRFLGVAIEAKDIDIGNQELVVYIKPK